MSNFPFLPPSSFPVTKSQYLPCELMPTTMIGERPGSGSITYGQNGVTGTREWVVPWREPSGKTYLDYIAQLIGLTAAGPGGSPSVTYPDVFSADLPWLFCQEVDMKGEDCVGVDSWGRIQYRRALLTAKYKAYESGETFHVAAQSLSMLEGSYAYLGPFTIPAPPPYQALTPSKKKIIDNPGVQLKISQLQELLAAPDLTDAQRAQYEAQLADLNKQVDLARDDEDIMEEMVKLQELLDPENDLTDAERAKIQAQADDLGKRLGVSRSAVTKPDPQWVNAYNQWLAGAITQCANPGVDDDFFQANKSGSVAQPLTKVIPLGEYSLERHQVLAPDFWTYITLLGTVNAFFFLGFPPWTAMFSGIEGKRGTLPNGTKVWALTLKFHFNPNSWNHIYRPDKGQWETVASVKMGQATYWSNKNTPSGSPAISKTVAFTPAQGELHNWLYRPADFSPLLMYS